MLPITSAMQAFRSTRRNKILVRQKGAPKDPLAVSIFDAVAQLGLSLEIQDRPKDAIVIESAERMPAHQFRAARTKR
jgi:uncharacterized protein (TIGR03435 family)